jgi:hypothetical protein
MRSNVTMALSSKSIQSLYVCLSSSLSISLTVSLSAPLAKNNCQENNSLPPSPTIVLAHAANGAARKKISERVGRIVLLRHDHWTRHSISCTSSSHPLSPPFLNLSEP